MEASNSVDGYAFWTFSDIFEENYLPSVPFHGGFGLLTLHGVAKPTYRAYQVLRGLGDELMLVDGHHPTLDAWVVRGPDSVAVLTTNHALPRHPIEDQRVSVRISGIARPSEVSMRRIDGTHANAKRAWLDMGAPEYPDDRQLDELHDASRLTEESCSWSFDDGTVLLSFVVPSHGVASVTLLVDRKQAHGAP
jgi:xylan 1,4-beta-xylosidase